MKIKLKNGTEVQLHEQNTEKIYKIWKEHDEEFNFDDIKSISNIFINTKCKMQMISDTYITDKNSIDMTIENMNIQQTKVHRLIIFWTG